jgi:RNA polymerase-binding transcription factor
MAQDPHSLTHARLQRLLDGLDARERELRALIAERRDALDDAGLAGDPTGDDADRAFSRDRSAVESDLLELHLRELARIEAARGRAAEGRYGLCEDCDEPILPGRLRANPTALRCAACQARREKLYAAP